MFCLERRRLPNNGSTRHSLPWAVALHFDFAVDRRESPGVVVNLLISDTCWLMPVSQEVVARTHSPCRCSGNEVEARRWYLGQLGERAARFDAQ